ncbi:MAG: lipoprotein-releasing system ATP-binding protein LolD [Flavobacteriales bacterium]|nr:lipoprotein-releasing system ATP-binding protein LolD [Flavobacteriales bacterium]
MIEVQKLYKSFDKKPILQNINIKIEKNEIVALQGPSGAGKTTLLKSIGLLDNIDAGSIIFDDQDITLLNNQEQCLFRNQSVGFVFQFHNLLPEFSALENVAMPALVSGKKINEVSKKALSLLKSLNIGKQVNQKPHEMSGGEQQRVAIARALINSPKLILADEPSGNLDSKQSVEMFKLFDRIRDEFSTTFLIITHNNQLAKLADRIIYIKDGEIN